MTIATASRSLRQVATARPQYDIFLSVAGPDRPDVRKLAHALRAEGLRVFLDEDSITHFSGISTSIEKALSSSKALLAYYSAEFARRPACQTELMMAFFAGQREGGGISRIMVINPEPFTDHLAPLEVADVRYARTAGDGSDLARLARLIRSKAAMIEGTIGDGITHRRHPRWFGRRMAGDVGIVGRYQELWSLHSALRSVDFPLILDSRTCATAAVCGPPGSGKSALVAAYAWRFGAAYQGGIYWLSLAGAPSTADGLFGRYLAECRLIARLIGIDCAPHSDERALVAVADHLAGSPAKSLWIVDDIPAGVEPENLAMLSLSAGSNVRTILVGTREVAEQLMPVVRVGPLTRRDTRDILSRSQVDLGAATADVADELVAATHGHAGTIVQAVNRLADRPDT